MENQFPPDCRCRTCKFYHKLKALKDGKWLINGCCTKDAETMRSLGSDALVIQTLEDDYCENYSKWK